MTSAPAAPSPVVLAANVIRGESARVRVHTVDGRDNAVPGSAPIVRFTVSIFLRPCDGPHGAFRSGGGGGGWKCEWRETRGEWTFAEDDGREWTVNYSPVIEWRTFR